jgi:hypothetical protein
MRIPKEICLSEEEFDKDSEHITFINRDYHDGR